MCIYIQREREYLWAALSVASILSESHFQAKDPALVRRYESWMTRIDPKTAEKIQAILDEALVDVYNVTQALPVGRK